MAENLTRAKIEKFVAAGVPPGKLEAVLWDSAVTGLGLRMRLTGSVFVGCFYIAKKGGGRSVPSRKATLGSWPSAVFGRGAGRRAEKAGEVASGADPALGARDEEELVRRTFVEEALESFDRFASSAAISSTATTILSTLRRGLGSFA